MPDNGPDWREQAAAAARAAGVNVSVDESDAVLMAEARNLLSPGGPLDQLASQLAADLAAKAPAPVTRAACATLLRAACNANALTLLGYTGGEICAVLSAAAAKLEMRAAP